MTNRKILVTTPDFPPKLGGLATYSLNLVNLLESLGHDVQVFRWERSSELAGSYEGFKDRELFFHIHYLGGFLGGFPSEKSINFCHGSELLFTSPSFLKRVVKKLTKSASLTYFRNSFQNIFISSYTRDLLQKEGLVIDYGRDLIFHNCIIVPKEENNFKKIKEKGPISLCSIARDVPHKNLEGVYKFAHLLANTSKREVNLSMTSPRFSSSKTVKFVNIEGATREELNQVYKESDLNILLSQDHTKKGFVEGFGLTTLEAAVFSTPSLVSQTGGLRENIHHRFNGYQLKKINNSHVEEFYKIYMSEYDAWSKNCYQHLKSSHDQDAFEKLLAILSRGSL